MVAIYFFKIQFVQKKLCNLTILTLFLIFVNQANSQNFWNTIVQSKGSLQKEDIYQKVNFPNQYQLLSLDVVPFQKELKKSANQNKIIIRLPNKNGVLNRFVVKETSNFEQALQQRFPQINSYTAKGLDDPSAVAKISTGVDGLHVVISSKKYATTYIDLYCKNKKNRY